MLHHTRVDPIIECHRAVSKLIFEVYVGGPRTKKIRDLGQGKIVRRDQPEGPSLEQITQDDLGPNAAVVRVGSLKKFVKQEEKRRRSLGEVY